MNTAMSIGTNYLRTSLGNGQFGSGNDMYKIGRGTMNAGIVEQRLSGVSEFSGHIFDKSQNFINMTGDFYLSPLFYNFALFVQNKC